MWSPVLPRRRRDLVRFRACFLGLLSDSQVRVGGTSRLLTPTRLQAKITNKSLQKCVAFFFHCCSKQSVWHPLTRLSAGHQRYCTLVFASKTGSSHRDPCGKEGQDITDALPSGAGGTHDI